MLEFERVVVGGGGVGSAALWHLARRGVRTLGIDQFTPPHDRGSSHGQTRIIRQAYFEHPMYVPMLRRAYELWEELERLSGQALFQRVGLLEVGPPDGIVLPGVARSVKEHGLPMEELSRREVHRRYPAFRIPAGMSAVFEPNAGFLHVERCVAAHLHMAAQADASFRWHTPVLGIEATDRGLIVRTADETIRCQGLIGCPGAWAPHLLKGMPKLRVLRKHLHWYAAQERQWQADAGCPAFFFELPTGYFYGFPSIDARGVKLAEHSGGELVVDPSDVSRHIDDEDERRVRAFSAECLPTLSGRHLDHAVCMYTMTDDQHFLVDRHPECDKIVFAAGLSGHGFKFATVLGEILAELSIEGHSSLPIDSLRLRRFAV